MSLCCWYIDWSRRGWLGFLSFDLIIDDYGDFFNFAIVYLLNNLYFIDFSLFIYYILLHDYYLVSMSESSRYLLLHCLLSILTHQWSQSLLQLVVVRDLLQHIDDMTDWFIQVVTFYLLDATPQFGQFGMVCELWMSHIDSEWPGKEFYFFELVCSEQFYVFGVGLSECLYVVLQFLSFIDEVLFALYFVELFWFEVVLLLEFSYFSESFVDVPYLFVQNSQERLVVLIECG